MSRGTRKPSSNDEKPASIGTSVAMQKRHARAFYEGKSLKSRECARDGKTPISWDQDGPRSSLTYLPHPYTLCRVVYTLSKATWGDVVTIGQSLKAMIFERISSFSRRFSTRSGT